MGRSSVPYGWWFGDIISGTILTSLLHVGCYTHSVTLNMQYLQHSFTSWCATLRTNRSTSCFKISGIISCWIQVLLALVISRLRSMSIIFTHFLCLHNFFVGVYLFIFSFVCSISVLLLCLSITSWQFLHRCPRMGKHSILLVSILEVLTNCYCCQGHLLVSRGLL